MAIFTLYGLEVEVADAGLSERLMRALSKGWYEREEAEIINFALKPGDRVVELGAGLGVTAMIAARVVGGEAVLAFEANPALIAQLKGNLKRNGFDIGVENAVLMPKCEIGQHKVAQLQVADEFWGSSVLPNNSGRGQTADVATKSLEDVVAAHGANTLIMDIEGYEVEILEKADLARIRKLIVEIHYDRVGAERTNKAIFKMIDEGFSIDFQRSSRGVLLMSR